MSLSTSQQVAVDGCLKAYQEGEREIGIQAGAGYGKTYSVKHILNKLGILDKTLFTAPTHEAGKQLGLDLPNTAHIATTYASFGVRVTDSQEEQYSVPAGDVDLSDFSCVLIDEVSMCGSVLHKRYKELRAKYPATLFIKLGDKYQLKPPREPVSQFILDYESHTNFTLTESMRMHPDSPVPATTNDIRGLIDSNYKGDVKFDKDLSEHGNLYVTGVKQFNESFGRAVASPEYAPNKIVAIAYTNARVDALNNLARRALGVSERDPWLVGDTIVMQHPLQEDGSTIIHTSASGVIRNVAAGTATSSATEDIWSEERIECRLLAVEFDDITTVLYVPTEEGGQAYSRGLAALKRRANKTQDKYHWMLYHRFRTSLAHIRHTYALTAHKSQGKSYDHTVYVDAVNIQDKKYKSDDMLNRMYVATTRTKQHLVIAQR